MADTKKKVLLISGGSGGIGRATAGLFAARGYVVYELSRRHVAQEGVVHLSADVTQEAQVKEAVQELIRREGQIDLLISNAGYGIAGPIEETAETDYLRQFDVNYFGTLRLCRAVLPQMRAQRSGRIICLSSVAGFLPIPFQAFYSDTKAALLSFVRSLNMEVKPFGIQVMALCPGDVATGFTAARETGQNQTGSYAARFQASLQRMMTDEAKGKGPDFVAGKLWQLSCKKHPKAQYVSGLDYKIFALLSKLLPLRFIDFLLGKMYA